MIITKEEFKKIVEESVSKSEVCRKIGIPTNGRGLHKITLLSEEYDIDISHFSHKAAINKFQRKYELVTKKCPVCGVDFQTNKGHSREKITCSYSCSNTHFRSGQNNPNWKNDINDWGYRKICFSIWKAECIICGFDKVIDVHHLDENHNNNTATNLIPLCPNHHKMYHTTQYKQEVLMQIKKIIGQ